jgi:predicted nucleic acid-binding protein
MTQFVLDASVAVKWFLPPAHERLTEEALELLKKFVQAEVRFIIPDLFWAEIASAFWKAIRLGRFDKTSARGALSYLGNCDLPAYSTFALLDHAFDIANTYNRSVYDSLYVALAMQTKSQLITADERLANALAAHFPVKWLGAI